ncbi:uncharacterized protein LOC132726340 [Ruditapes philippinarum]|uniref:uncharacterized protein LOC132726340 n=1 Tax=Ruditapes philippinarum TaxID=129788 RepID=UPI00295C0D03|nr:uncharacterized protein LOC132726340 [Ruditapes philippinarum]
MDWWCLGIIVCSAVIVTLCSASEGTLHDDYDATPGTHMFDADECPPNTIFCLFSSRCVNLDGSCIVPPTCKQGEVLQENRLGVYRCVTAEDNHVNEPEHCKEGQIFCIQERRCVNMDGTCPTEPTCGQYQMLCNRDGTLTCVEGGSCSHVEAGFYLEQADYNNVVGEAYEHLEDFKDHVKQLLSKNIPGSGVNDFYDMSVERGSIDIRLSASSRLLDYFINIMTSRIQFMTDLQGEQMTINYDKSYAEFKKGYHVDCTDNTCTSCPVGQKYDVMHSGCVSVLDDQLPDYEGMHGGQKKCKLGMIFCLQAQRCVNLDGTCDDEPSCDTHQVMCKTDRGLMCVDHGQCNYAEVIIYVDNTDFNAVIGPDFENMKGFIGHFKKDLLAKVPGAMDTDVWNFETTSGSIVIEFFMSSQFYSRLMELKQSGSQFISNFNEHSLHIDWEKSSAHIHTAYHQDFYTECQDEHCITCPKDSRKW